MELITTWNMFSCLFVLFAYVFFLYWMWDAGSWNGGEGICWRIYTTLMLLNKIVIVTAIFVLLCFGGFGWLIAFV